MVKKFFKHGCGGRKNWRMKNCQGEQKCAMTPLSQKHTCGIAKVCGINGDRKHCARLAALGLYPGNEIELVSPANGSECIIKVHGGTFSLDRDTTENILITE